MGEYPKLLTFAVVVSIIIVIFQATTQVLTWVYWWQKKEYRPDRFKTIFGSHSRKKELGLNAIYAKLVVLLLSLTFWPLLFVYLVVANLLGVKAFVKLWRGSLKKPVFTQRVKRILLVTFLLAVLPQIFGKNPMKSLLYFEALILFGPYLGIMLTKPAVNRARKIETSKAYKKLRKVKPRIIGITGSYGKSTTKDFIAQLLSPKYKTLATYKNHNTDFGIARRVISDIKPSTEVFVAEMGAYKKGEIADIAKFVRPDIAVITGIEAQHLDLFGSIDNILDAKFELIEALSKDGIAAFNVSNKYCAKLAKRAENLGTQLEVLRYYLVNKSNGKRPANLDMEARVKSASADGIVFEVKERGGKWNKLSTHLHGVHFVENLAGAILVARKLGVGWTDIKEVVSKIKSPEGTMSVTERSGVVVIDDSYNSTPSGFLAALDYLSLFKGYKKFVVTPGIIELGKDTKIIHQRIARKMEEVGVSTVFLTTRDFKKIFDGELKGIEVKFLKSNTQLKKALDAKAVVLVEGRVSDTLVKT